MRANRSRAGTVAVIGGASLLGLLFAAAAPAQTPDWPCAQRLVPVLSFGQFWAGPPASSDWRSDPRIVDLVRAVAPRSVPPDTAIEKLRAFSDALPEPERATKLPVLFAGLVDETNQQRHDIIDRIKALGRRQRDVEHVVATLNAELADQPSDAETASRADAMRQRDLVVRMFQDTQRTLRYACELPTALEARLGRFTAVLQDYLPK